MKSKKKRRCGHGYSKSGKRCRACAASGKRLNYRRR